MRKNLNICLLLFALLLSCVAAKAQVNIEPYLGLTYPVRNIGASEVKEVAGLNAGIEVRYNFPSVPVAVGGDLFVATSSRQKDKPEGGQSNNGQRMVGIAAVCDYN